MNQKDIQQLKVGDVIEGKRSIDFRLFKINVPFSGTIEALAENSLTLKTEGHLSYFPAAVGNRYQPPREITIPYSRIVEYEPTSPS